MRKPEFYGMIEVWLGRICKIRKRIKIQVVFFKEIGYNNTVSYKVFQNVLDNFYCDFFPEKQGRNACGRICGRAGSVRRGAVNHVRRGTEQH